MSQGYGKMILLLQLIPIIGALLFAVIMAADAILYIKTGEEISDTWGMIAMTGWLLAGAGVGTGSMGLLQTLGNKEGRISKRMRRVIMFLSGIALVVGLLGVGAFLWVITHIHV